MKLKERIIMAYTKSVGRGRLKNKEFTKTYKPFIGWLIGFLIISILIPIIMDNFFDVSAKVLTLITLFITVISLYLLMLLVYKGEYVYWINGGPDYEKAKAAGSKKRKKYAKAHFDLFTKMTVVCCGYGMVSILLNMSIWIDSIIITAIVVVTGFLTIPIKFDVS